MNKTLAARMQPFKLTATPRTAVIGEVCGLASIEQEVWSTSRTKAARIFAMNVARFVNLDGDVPVETLERVASWFLITESGREVRGVVPNQSLPTFTR